MIEVWDIKTENYAGYLASVINGNGTDLPPALPWVEPTINNLWLEACKSFLYGNYQATVITTSVTLETALRMSLVNRNETPSPRDNHDEIFEKDGLRQVINAAKTAGILSKDSKKWWEQYCEHIRNKICHGDLVHVLDNCRNVSSFENYYDKVETACGINTYSYQYVVTHPAAFSHKAGKIFGRAFLRDAYCELDSLIKRTQWCEYDEWWRSQKDAYESFFAFDWNYGNLKQGIETARRPLASSK